MEKDQSWLTSRFDDLDHADNLDFLHVALCCDVVFAAWKDPSEPGGVGRMIVQGEEYYREAVPSGNAGLAYPGSGECYVNALRCRDRKQAQALADYAQARVDYEAFNRMQAGDDYHPGVRQGSYLHPRPDHRPKRRRKTKVEKIDLPMAGLQIRLDGKTLDIASVTTMTAALAPKK